MVEFDLMVNLVDGLELLLLEGDPVVGFEEGMAGDSEPGLEEGVFIH